MSRTQPNDLCSIIIFIKHKIFAACFRFDGYKNTFSHTRTQNIAVLIYQLLVNYLMAFHIFMNKTASGFFFVIKAREWIIDKSIHSKYFPIWCGQFDFFLS